MVGSFSVISEGILVISDVVLDNCWNLATPPEHISWLFGSYSQTRFVTDVFEKVNSGKCCFADSKYWNHVFLNYSGINKSFCGQSCKIAYLRDGNPY